MQEYESQKRKPMGSFKSLDEIEHKNKRQKLSEKKYKEQLEKEQEASGIIFKDTNLIEIGDKK